MNYDVVTYGDPALRRQAEPIEKIDDELRRLAGDMLRTMYATSGVGLAAEQIGLSRAICVIDLSGGDENRREPIVMLNPRILESEGIDESEEGCLSVPEVFPRIGRSLNVKAVYLDLDGNERGVEASGLLARAIQHEIDHLNGVLIIDRMSRAERAAFSGRLKKLKKNAAVR
ncbi:MAG: peptide deformylase [Kiritimatiellia bacterium]